MTIIHRIEVPIPFPLKTVNCYYIPDSNPTLVDTGVNSAEGLDIIEKNMRSAGGRLSDLKRIILTHGHTDHVGLAGKIASHSRAAVFIHPWDRDKIPVEGESWLAGRLDMFRGFLTEAGLPGVIGRQIQRHHRVRREHVLNLLKAAADRPETDGGLTPYRVARQLFADIRDVDIFLALSEAIGHLDYLKAKGAADMQLHAGTRVYRRTAKGD